MRILACLVALGSATAGARGLDLGVQVDGRTFLSYEPVYVEVTLTNNDSVARTVPRFPSVAHPAYLDVAVVNGGDTYRYAFHSMHPAPFDPRSGLGVTLAPGESQYCRFDAGDWMGERVDGRGDFIHLPPGTYHVAVAWETGLFPPSMGLTSEAVTSADFEVRSSTGDTARAAKLYAERLYFQWGNYWHLPESRSLDTPEKRVLDSDRRSLDLARTLLREYPYMEAFVAPTLAWLTRRMLRDHLNSKASGSPAVTPSADSVAAIYRSLIEGHPDSPTAVAWLSLSDVLDKTKGLGAHHAYLTDLAVRLKGTRVGVEAARILSGGKH